jgi:hypothetical protein
MRPSRKEQVSALFWFQSLEFARMAASYSAMKKPRLGRGFFTIGVYTGRT